MSTTASPVKVAGASLWYADVRYLGVARLISCGIMETSDGLFLVDPGPSVSLGTLESVMAGGGMSFADVAGVLLTHIHLDHAGATGSIVQSHPHVTVYVHARGARHLARPERLLASARRIYGSRMETQWGAFLAVPEGSIHVLEGGERLSLGGRSLRVAYTPGHASHHVSFLDEQTGIVFSGDTAGMRVMGTPYIVPVAPPPDIDVEAWCASLDLLRAWAPEQLFVTHFGLHADVGWHLSHTEERLRTWASMVRTSFDRAGDDADRAAHFHAQEMAQATDILPVADQEPYHHMGQPRESWYGLARYWRKRAEGN